MLYVYMQIMLTQQADEAIFPLANALWIFWDSISEPQAKSAGSKHSLCDAKFVNPNSPIPLHAGKLAGGART